MQAQPKLLLLTNTFQCLLQTYATSSPPPTLNTSASDLASMSSIGYEWMHSKKNQPNDQKKNPLNIYVFIMFNKNNII